MNESIPLPLPARQARSLKTADAILDAAETLLRERGLQACSVPEVARRSRRGVGSVYRRFGDKERLLKAVLIRYASQTQGANAAAAEKIKRRADSLETAARLIVGGIVAGRRRDWRIVAAFAEAARESPDEEFKRLAEELRVRTLPALAQVLAAKCEGKAADAPSAEFIILCVVELLDAWVRDRPEALDEPDLATQLARLIVGYLREAPLRSAHQGRPTAPARKRRAGAPLRQRPA